MIGADDPGYDDVRRVVLHRLRPSARGDRPRRRRSPTSHAWSTWRGRRGAELAVRSGGHSRAGHGTSEGGIVLDLSAMNAVEIDADGRTAWAQTGVTAGDYTQGDRRTTASRPGSATRRASVSAGSPWPAASASCVRRNGLTIDDLLAAEVVTADGELLEVDETTPRRSLLGSPGRRRQLRCRDETAAPAPRDRRGRRWNADAARERRRDHRAGRRGGRGARGALRDRERR